MVCASAEGALCPDLWSSMLAMPDIPQGLCFVLVLLAADGPTDLCSDKLPDGPLGFMLPLTVENTLALVRLTQPLVHCPTWRYAADVTMIYNLHQPIRKDLRVKCRSPSLDPPVSVARSTINN